MSLLFVVVVVVAARPPSCRQGKHSPLSKGGAAAGGGGLFCRGCGRSLIPFVPFFSLSFPVFRGGTPAKPLKKEIKMKKAVIAVATVLMFIFTLTQKSEAISAGNWAALSRLISNNTDYYSSPIVLTDNISGANFALFDLSANKTITSASGQSFSLTFDTPQAQSAMLGLTKKKLMFKKISLLTFSNAADSAIYNINLSLITFDSLTVNFLGNNSADDGGAISNDGIIIFKGASSVIFENNTAPKGADIYNSGTIEISERSEVILRSGIDGNPTKDGVINIKSGTLTISADEIFIIRLNVWVGGKFSLVDREAISKAKRENLRSSSFVDAAEAEFAAVYKTKTAQIDSLTVAGILEIGIDLSTDNINDLISSADSITFQKGSSLKIVPFNKWSSPKTYSIIFEGELRGFENLDYDRSRFVLSYDEKTKTLSLKAISDPTL
jgi:predicted outer membrane repeat protein